MANTVGPDYFRTLRINMVAGRPFEDRDHETAQPVIVVNNTLAERFWGSAANAIGKHMRVGNGESRTVIGVAADLKYSRINEAPRPYFYQPIHQVYRTAMVLYVARPGIGGCPGPPGARARRRDRRRSAGALLAALHHAVARSSSTTSRR